MSDDDSENEAELGQNAAANASDAPTALAALRSQNLERLVEEQNWHDKNDPDFRERVLAARYRIPDGHEQVRQQVIKRPDSETSSMAVSLATRSSAFGSTASVGYPPSLLSSSTGYISNSLQTSRLDSLVQQVLLEEGPGGALEVPAGRTEGRLACSFSFLDCDFRSDDLGEWDTHCQSHLYGHLPLTVHCPFSCDWNKTATAGREAWQARIIHIVSEHRGDGAVDTDRRPESSLIQHLWRKGIIDDAQLKELRSKGRLTGPQIFMRTAGSARDRRTDRRPRAAVRR